MDYSIALSDEIDNKIKEYLIRSDSQEDLLFCLWTPSVGSDRLTALIHTPVWPIDGDRQIHGNASFNLQYFDRVCSLANQRCEGIAFLHSHPYPGWQKMSDDDIAAEQKMMGSVAGLTDLPLVGMTVGSDGTWSGRMWVYQDEKKFNREWCSSIRAVGKRLSVNFADFLAPPPGFQEIYKRTVTAWGKENHSTLARLTIGIVGLGSVGSIVAELLARMGIGRFILIDHDEVQEHNLDRLLGATRKDIGELKVNVVERQIRSAATAEEVSISSIPYSVAEKEGYSAALNCDVIFCCVDRPRPRSILNHFAYAHMIPVIDGGIAVRFKDEKFSGVDWQLQTVAPGRPCLACLGAYKAGDVSTEIEGKLEDPSYLKGLPRSHRFLRNENVVPFSMNLASLEVLQFVELVTGIGGMHDFGVQRYRYIPGILDSNTEHQCDASCESLRLIAQGDRFFSLSGKDIGAELARNRQRKSKMKS